MKLKLTENYQYKNTGRKILQSMQNPLDLNFSGQL